MIKLGFELGLHAVKRLVELRLKEGASLDEIYIEILDLNVEKKTERFYQILQKKV